MTTHPGTMNAQRRRPVATASQFISADRTFKTGVLMCIIWLGAATMLVLQAQRTDLVGSSPALKHVFLVPGR